MQEADRIRLRHMLDASRQALEFSQNRTRADLDDDLMFLLSLVKLIEIVGEAARQVTNEGRADAQGIPWPDIIGMRNRLVHMYFAIDHDVLWATVKYDLPLLIPLLEQALGEGTG